MCVGVYETTRMVSSLIRGQSCGVRLGKFTDSHASCVLLIWRPEPEKETSHHFSLVSPKMGPEFLGTAWDL